MRINLMRIKSMRINCCI